MNKSITLFSKIKNTIFKQDLRLVDNDVSTSGMSVAGAGCSTETAEDEDDHAMNLFEIGRFLEFNFLSLSCEDLLMQHLVKVLTVIWEKLRPYYRQSGNELVPS